MNNTSWGLTILTLPGRKLATLLWQRRWVVGASVVAAVIIGGLYYLVTPQVLETSASVHVDVLDQLLPDSAATASNVLAVQPGIMRSTAVVALAVASPDIHRLSLVQSDNASIAAVQSRLTVQSAEQLGDFDILLNSSKPRDAEKLLDSVIAAYISLETAERVQSSDALTTDLVEQQRKTAAELEIAKGLLDDATKRQTALEPDPEARRLYAQQRADASTALSEARQKADDARGPYERAIQFFGDEDKLNQAALPIFSQPDSSSDVDPEVILDRILQLQRHLGQKNWPSDGAYKQQVAQLSAEYAAGARDRYQTAIANQSQAQSRFDQLEKRTQDIDALDDESTRLQTQVDHLSSLNSELTDRLGHSALASESRVAITILKPAETSQAPVWPRPLPIFGVAVLAGLLLGCGLVATLDKVDTRLRDPADARASAAAPLLGQLPCSPSDMTSLAERGQCVLLKPDDPCALAYHALRNSLEETLTPGTDKTILITSPADSRGTSVLASNLAISTARSGKRVALVDARHSLRAINEIYGIEDHIGLSDAITGRLKVAAALHVTGLDGLEVLPVGSAEADWAELLNRPEFLQVLTELTERFDRVIIDGGCALSGECRIISAFCDATLLFADGRKSDRNDLRAAAEGLRAVGANIVGIALKGVSSQSSSTELTLAWSQLRGLWSRSASPRQGFKNSNTVSKTNGKKSRDAFAASFPDRSGLTSDGAPVESDGSRIS